MRNCVPHGGRASATLARRAAFLHLALAEELLHLFPSVPRRAPRLDPLAELGAGPATHSSKSNTARDESTIVEAVEGAPTETEKVRRRLCVEQERQVARRGGCGELGQRRALGVRIRIGYFLVVRAIVNALRRHARWCW